MSKKHNEGYTKSLLFKKTLPYILHEWPLVIITIILALIIAFITTYTPLILKEILDDWLINDTLSKTEITRNINKLLVIYGALTIVVVLARYFLSYFQTLTGMHIEKRLRENAIRKIDYLPVDYYSLEPDGKIVAKITSDTNGVRTFYQTMFSIAQAILNIIAVYVGLILLEPKLSIIILILVPILLFWITFYRKRVHSYYLELRETGSRITGKLNELISGALIIQDFNQEDAMMDDYKSLVNKYNDNDKKANTVSAYFGFELLSLLKGLAIALILYYFGFRYVNVSGAIVTVGLIQTYTNYLDRMIQPINQIFNNLNELEDSLVAANRIFMFMDEKNDSHVLDGEMFDDNIKGDVEFKDVSFAYVNEKYVLKNVNLTAAHGQTIGIVGHTGSGKSSMMNLLLRYNDNQDGQILVDGRDISKYNKQSYRKCIGIVLQSPALFAGTLRDNVTMERDYPDEEIIKALDEVGASYLLTKTNEGLDMPISFKGENLSLGEKQLIAFARVLLRNPKILVLDEATANIDTETENKIKTAMNAVTKGRTTFIIAHRLSTIKDADKIVVLDDGKIIGEGSHHSLYDNCKVYKDMYDSQFKK